jgi:uncharacterized protein YecE (DUF72 family)
MSARVRVGTSGWQYPHWRGDLYPRGLSTDRWLEHYAAEFDTVELNNSFYRLPDADQFDAWAQRVPQTFRFAVKASRYLTHVRRLREPSEPLRRLWDRARRLGDRFGPVLYQLPTRWRVDVERLEEFLDEVPRGHDQAIEFRDRSWYAEPVLAALRAHAVALCLHDMPGSASPREAVGPLVYVRFHGSGARYGGRYSSQLLAAWADRMAAWSGDGLPVWGYFNNDVGGHAVRDAQRLRALLERRGVG